MTNGALASGQKIRAARLRVNLSQDEVAEKCGVRRETVTSWERSGTKHIRFKKFRLLTTALDVEGTDLAPSPGEMAIVEITTETEERLRVLHKQTRLSPEALVENLVSWFTDVGRKDRRINSAVVNFAKRDEPDPEKQ